MKKSAVYVLLAAILWGTAGIFVRELSALGADNMTQICTRSLLSALLLLLMQGREAGSMLRIVPRKLPSAALGGLIGILGLTLCYNLSMDNLSLSLAAVLLRLSALFTPAAAWILFREKAGVRTVLCAVMTVIGCLIAGAGNYENGGISVFGIVCGVGAALCNSAYVLFSRKLKDVSAMTVTFYGILSVGLCSLPFCDFGTVAAICASGIKGPALLVLQALILSAVPYLLYNKAIRGLKLGLIAVMAALEPVSATVTGILVYGEMPGIAGTLGLLICLLAVLIVNMDRPALAERGHKAYRCVCCETKVN